MDEAEGLGTAVYCTRHDIWKPQSSLLCMQCIPAPHPTIDSHPRIDLDDCGLRLALLASRRSLSGG